HARRARGAARRPRAARRAAPLAGPLMHETPPIPMRTGGVRLSAATRRDAAFGTGSARTGGRVSNRLGADAAIACPCQVAVRTRTGQGSPPSLSGRWGVDTGGPSVPRSGHRAAGGHGGRPRPAAARPPRAPPLLYPSGGGSASRARLPSIRPPAILPAWRRTVFARSFRSSGRYATMRTTP